LANAVGEPAALRESCPIGLHETTDREKDYVVIGELARRMKDPADQLRFSRSALDLMRLAEEHPCLIASLSLERPLLSVIKEGRDALESALDAERRRMIHADEKRLAQYETASLSCKRIGRTLIGRWRHCR